MMKGVNRKRLATLSLMVATFLCPLGFDVAFYMVQDIIGSYWGTTIVFYVLSALFFGLYFFLRDKK